jgi:small-conductance mechanosensitive channel
MDTFSHAFDDIIAGMSNDFIERVQSILRALGTALPFAPPWAVSLVILVGATATVWLLHAAILAGLRRLLRGRRPYLQSLLDQTRHPTRLALLLIALAIALPAAPLGADSKTVIVQFLILGTICLLGWIALTAAHIGANLYLMRFRLDIEDNLLARKHVTQVRVLLRVTDTVIVLATLGFALMTFAAVRQYGVSLFASAGAAGVIFGLAAQPVLSNLIAGVQLAVTQPIRLEDAVTVQNSYGWIEEINATYVVIRLDDQRRMIVPLNYFIQQPFYNWTRQAAPTIGSLVLYLDYAAPVDLIRKKAAELVAETKQDNPRVTGVQVTNASAEAIEVQIQLNSDSAATTGNVSADLREKLIAFLQREHPEALPRRRTEIVDISTRKPSEPPAASERIG